MDARYIALAVPFFFALIGVEWLVARARNRPSHRLYDAIGSLSCGVGQQLLAFFFAVTSVGIYAAVHARFALLHITASSWVAWLVLLFADDLCYYAFHRAAHRINFLWAVHVVHHQSEDYNLATALRQAWFGPLVSWVFYLPLAVIGFPPTMFVTMVTINTLYQFWIHTRVVGRLGPLEWVMNTPSHHRVHHGIDPEYIDANYAGMFIVWDRLFGTFVPEGREPTYGTVKPLGTFNPLWANLEGWARIVDLARRTRSPRDKLLAWVMPPEWQPEDLGGRVAVPPVDHARYVKHDVEVIARTAVYITVSFALAVVAATAYLWCAPSWPFLHALLVAGVLIVGLIAWSGLMEGRRWARRLELARLTAIPGVAWMLAPGTSGLVLGAGALTLASSVALWRLK